MIDTIHLQLLLATFAGRLLKYYHRRQLEMGGLSLIFGHYGTEFLEGSVSSEGWRFQWELVPPG